MIQILSISDEISNLCSPSLPSLAAIVPSLVESSIRKSLADLQLDYVDLFLIHTPFGLQAENGQFKRDADGAVVVDPSTDHLAVWKVREHSHYPYLSRLYLSFAFL